MLKFPLTRFATIREMGVFTQNLNSLTGRMTWEAKDEKYDYHQEIARSGFADMLHDHERNAKYESALARAIKEKHSKGEEANVLDIGTGTGLLSMMAAKHKADSIIACEAFTPMAECALKIIEENGFKDMIKLVQKRSTILKVGPNGDMEKRANILVTEVFDTELIGEGALSTFQHACQELLEPDSIVIPSSGTIWVQIVQSSLIDSWNRLKPICDTNGRTLLNVPTEFQSCPGIAAVHDLQLSQLPPNSFEPLTTPQPLFRFDFSGKTPLLFDEKSTLKIEPHASGIAHAVFVWWDLDMGWNEILSCAPIWAHPLRNKITTYSKPPVSNEELIRSIPWRDHWMQAIYYFPHEISIERGKNVNLIGHHDEYSFWFQLKNDENDVSDCPSPVCRCGLHVAYSRTRLGQLNDVKRNNNYIRALEKKITPNTVCLCLSDGCMLGLAAANLGAKKIYILELNFLSRRTIEMFLDKNELSNKVEIINSLENLPPSEEINLIFGEPFFIGSILPWENLRFAYIISKYNGVQRIPISATIRGMAMSFYDLQTIRAFFGTTLGFDLTSFDNLVQASSDKTDNTVEAQPLWEYPGIPLSLPFDIVKFDLTDNIENKKRIQLTDIVPIEVEGLYNGVALWVDWRLDDDIVVSCGPIQEIQLGTKVSWDPFTRQGVHLVEKETQVTKKHTLSWSFNFVPEHGDMEFNFNLAGQ